MANSNNKLFTPRNDGNYVNTKEQQRLQALLNLGLQQSEMIPVFEEAAQTAAHFLEVEISILGFIDQKFHWFKSAVGLSRLGLMNDLASKRQLLRRESFCSQVVETLAELHHGQISIQGSVESGYRYIVSLPLKFATSSASS
ncbi:MAG: hypothetical protein AN486_13490 [Anabaena sp. AL93]|nr:MAG: hypothetical protein AN486_13490 [Anabaena sp. AL93]